MIKQIIKRFFEWIFLSVIMVLVILIISNLSYYKIDWSFIGGFLVGYFICLIFRTPYNKEEIELDNYIEKNNKNGFD